MIINKHLRAAIREHAEREHPREACGLLIRSAERREYVPCGNIARTPSEHFIIDPADWAQAEDRGRVLAIIHSHPDATATASMVDRVACELHGLPWGIVSWPGGDMEWIQPSGYTAPLLGRDFGHGMLDCWAACRDWYAREAGIQLPDFQRPDLWWEEPHSPSFYEDNYAACGFERVEQPRRGDLLVLQIPSPGRPCHHPNHGAIYLGDDPSFSSEPAPPLGGSGPFIFHHLYGSASRRDVFGHSMGQRVRLILRHREYPA